jgi:hypothetical protein
MSSLRYAIILVIALAITGCNTLPKWPHCEFNCHEEIVSDQPNLYGSEEGEP